MGLGSDRSGTAGPFVSGDRAAAAAVDSDGPVGVLLVNLGSPDAPTTAAVRRYLDEFLGDPLVVDLNRALWWLIRKGIVLPFRAPKSAALYRSIWTPDGSPLVASTRALRRELAAELGPSYRVAFAMRYGNPSLRSGLADLAESGCRRAVVVPLFPQFSRTTTGSVALAVGQEIAAMPAAGQPLDYSLVEPFYEDPGYVSTVAAIMRESGARDADHVVLSFHGLPERYVEAGDPYRDHCEATARALAAELELEEGRWSLGFQSRFGREPWLEPNVAELVPALATGCKRVLVACPGFTADCLETLEEIHIRLREDFLAAGGSELRVAPCLNDDRRWARVLARLVAGEAARDPGRVLG